MRKILAALLISTIFISCSKEPEIDNATMLDGDQIFDLSLSNPQDYLISSRFPNPTEVQKNTPVIIAAHGFTATTFEWDELREFADQKGSFLVSQVLLGGHGRTYDEFKNATWEDWGRSIEIEYQDLVAKGYRKIYIAASSTGGALVLNSLNSGVFNVNVKGIFLVDPIVVPSNKSLSLIGTLGPLIGYSTTELATGEKGHWYVYRPYQALRELMECINKTRKNLQDGMDLPPVTFMKVYKSLEDESADPVSAVLIYKGIKTVSPGQLEVEMLHSKLHVATRLRGRDGVTAEDRAMQSRIFTEMELKMLE